MRENGFLEEEKGLGTVTDLLGGRPAAQVVTADAAAPVRDVIETMKRHGISQLPVLEHGKLRGMVQEVDLLRHLVKGSGTLDSSIADLIESDYATVTPATKVELLEGRPQRRQDRHRPRSRERRRRGHQDRPHRLPRGEGHPRRARDPHMSADPIARFQALFEKAKGVERTTPRR